ncbi:MAG: hypothetical protein ACRYFU_02245 [Janthinobacterium lividum]
MHAAIGRAQTVVSIHDIMTTTGTYPLPNSPYLYSHYGESVSVTGVVVGVMSTGDFYISEPSDNWESLVATAEGMPICAAAGNNPSCAVVGNSVTAIGDVVEVSAVTAADTPGTGIQPTSCTVNSTGNTMTQAISISSALESFGGALEYTGMAANNSTFYVVAPTSGTLAESTQTVTSNGQFWATLADNASTNNHLFRSPGIARDEYTPSTGSAITSWAGNPPLSETVWNARMTSPRGTALIAIQKRSRTIGTMCGISHRRPRFVSLTRTGIVDLPRPILVTSRKPMVAGVSAKLGLNFVKSFHARDGTLVRNFPRLTN